MKTIYFEYFELGKDVELKEFYFSPSVFILANDCNLNLQSDFISFIEKYKRKEFGTKMYFSYIDKNEKIAWEPSINFFIPIKLPFPLFTLGAGEVLDWWFNILSLSAEKRQKYFEKIEVLGLKKFLNANWKDIPNHIQLILMIIAQVLLSDILYVFWGEKVFSQDVRDYIYQQLSLLLKGEDKNIFLFADKFKITSQVKVFKFQGFLLKDKI